MAVEVPMQVPVEIAPAGASEAGARVFRLSAWLGVDRLLLAAGLPDEPDWLRGPLRILFHVPGDPLAVTCVARAGEVVVDEGEEQERAERRALVFEALPADAAERLARYVEARVDLR